jgi:NodT family efflux transporter outer membrane factor (OMF) lipoprotein
MAKYLLYLLPFCFWWQANAQSDSTLSLKNSLPDNDQWWQLFGDEMLPQLIHKAIIHNYDLQSALKKIEMARSKVRTARSEFYPELSSSIAFSPEKSSLGIDQSDSYHRIGQAGFQLNWELDLFGRIRKNVKAQKQYYQASQEEYRGVMVSLAAEVANSYIQLRSYQQQWKITQANLNSQAKILHINEVKAEAGLTSQLAVAQSKSLWLETQASLPGIESAIHEQATTLLTLLGEYNDTLYQQLTHHQPFPSIIGIQIKGIPAELLRQRPDIQSAEKNIEALASTLGATRADWWPQFYLNGSIGYGNHYFEQILKKENLTWQIAPSVQWTLFKGRQVTENIRQAQLQLDEGIEQYNETVLTALQEIDYALFAYHQSLLQLKATKAAFEQICLTLEYAIDLYNQGLADYQSVLDSQRNVLSYENTLLNAQSNTLLLLIQLYKAIGGGFQSSSSSNLKQSL